MDSLHRHPEMPEGSIGRPVQRRLARTPGEWCLAMGGTDQGGNGATSSAGCNEDSVKILGFWHFFVSRSPRNLRPEPSSSLVSTSFTHSGGDEDPGDPGIILLLFCWNLRKNLPAESSSKTFACILHWRRDRALDLHLDHLPGRARERGDAASGVCAPTWRASRTLSWRRTPR